MRRESIQSNDFTDLTAEYFSFNEEADAKQEFLPEECEALWPAESGEERLSESGLLKRAEWEGQSEGREWAGCLS